MSAEQNERLLAHVLASNTRWFRVSGALLDFGRRGVPEHRDSYNPIKWLIAQTGLWMQSRHIDKVNRGLAEKYADKMLAPRALTTEDQQRIADLLAEPMSQEAADSFIPFDCQMTSDCQCPPNARRVGCYAADAAGDGDHA